MFIIIKCIKRVCYVKLIWRKGSYSETFYLDVKLKRNNCMAKRKTTFTYRINVKVEIYYYSSFLL